MKAAKKILSIVLASVVSMIAFPMSFIASAEEPKLTISEDYTAMSASNSITAAQIGAESICNLQIGTGYDNIPALYCVNGYTDTYAIFKVNAQDNYVLKTLSLSMTGRICDYTNNGNVFRIYTSTTNNFDFTATPAYEQTMGVTDIPTYNLSTQADGQSVLYIAVYMVSKGSPEWIAIRTLNFTATQETTVTESKAGNTESTTQSPTGITTDASTEETTTQTTAETTKAGLGITTSKLSVSEDFTGMATSTNLTASGIGAETIYNLQIGSGYENIPALYPIDGYKDTAAIYKIYVKDGYTLDDLTLSLNGRIYDYANNGNVFKIFTSTDGNFDWNNDAPAVKQDMNVVMGDVKYDLSKEAEGHQVLYVAIYMLSKGSPEWLAIRSLKLSATEVVVSNSSSSSSSVKTGDTASTLPIFLFNLSAVIILSAVIYAKKRRSSDCR